MNIEVLARRAYELSGKRGVAPWDSLSPTERCILTARYARVRAAYDAGRGQPTESVL